MTLQNLWKKNHLKDWYGCLQCFGTWSVLNDNSCQCLLFCNVNFIFTIQGVVGATKPISPIYYFWRLFFGLVNTPCKIVFINARYRRSLASMMCTKYRSGLKDLTDALLDIRVTSHERWNVGSAVCSGAAIYLILAKCDINAKKSMLWRHQSECSG